MLGLLGGLSVASDLGTGAPLEESLRRCVVSVRLARAAGCADDEVSDVIYTSLLQHLGCTAYSHEAAHVWGDDIASTRLALLTDFEEPRDIFRTWVPGLAASTGWSQARALGTTLRSARRFGSKAPVATCEVAHAASRRLCLPRSVQDGLLHVLAMWNGKGYPSTAGDAIPLPARVMHVASTAVMFCLHAGPVVAISEVRRRAGTYLDPDLAHLFDSRAAQLLEDLDGIDAYQAVLDLEPDPVRLVDNQALETVARTFGDLVDLKSP